MYASLVESGIWLALGWTMLHFLWVGAAIGGLTWIGRRALVRATPELRYVLTLGCLAALTMAPVAIGMVVYEPPPVEVAITPQEDAASLSDMGVPVSLQSTEQGTVDQDAPYLVEFVYPTAEAVGHPEKAGRPKKVGHPEEVCHPQGVGYPNKVGYPKGAGHPMEEGRPGDGGNPERLLVDDAGTAFEQALGEAPESPARRCADGITCGTVSSSGEHEQGTRSARREAGQVPLFRNDGAIRGG